MFLIVSTHITVCPALVGEQGPLYGPWPFNRFQSSPASVLSNHSLLIFIEDWSVRVRHVPTTFPTHRMRLAVVLGTKGKTDKRWTLVCLGWLRRSLPCAWTSFLGHCWVENRHGGSCGESRGKGKCVLGSSVKGLGSCWLGAPGTVWDRLQLLWQGHRATAIGF